LTGDQPFPEKQAVPCGKEASYCTVIGMNAEICPTHKPEPESTPGIDMPVPGVLIDIPGVEIPVNI